MPGMPTPGYNNSNRAFLQAFLAHSTLTDETAKPILAGIFSVDEGREVLPNDITQEDFSSYVSAANTALSPLDLEIRGTFHQITRERIYALINLTSDEGIKLATSHTAEEIAFVKRVLDAMFETNNKPKKEAMCVSNMDALRLNKPSSTRDTQNGTSQASGQGLSMRDAEAMMTNLVDEGWLEKSKKSFYSLSPRALMELRGWLVDTYNEPEAEAEEGEDEDERQPRHEKIKTCNACKEIITVGQRCADLKCPARLHDICTQNFFRMQRGNMCPVCKKEWDGKHYVGEKAITTSESYLNGKRRSTNTRPAMASSERDGDGEMEAD
jgi:non-structural maintenance of chromosomes element 1